MSSDGEHVEIHKKDAEAIRVARRRYEGHEYIDIRTYFSDDHNEFRPAKKGVTFPPDLLGKVIDALKKLADGAE